MELFFQQVLNGAMLGSTYAMVALGLTLVFGILHVPNFAHGHIYMLGAYVTFFLITLYGFGFWPAVIVSMLMLGLAGMVIERLVFRPLKNQPPINMFIAAIAAAAASLMAPIFMVSSTMGSLLVMKAFVIIILGGLGSMQGAILGGYMLGLIEALGGGFISAAYKDVFAFGALVLILALKPTGLFGKEPE